MTTTTILIDAIETMIKNVEAEAEVTWNIMTTAGRDVVAKHAAMDKYDFLAAVHQSLGETRDGLIAGITIDTMIHDAKAALIDAEFEAKNAARALEVANTAGRATGEDRRRVAKADVALVECRGRLAGVMRAAGN